MKHQLPSTRPPAVGSFYGIHLKKQISYSRDAKTGWALSGLVALALMVGCGKGQRDDTAQQAGVQAKEPPTKSQTVVKVSVNEITDQAALAKIAVEDKDAAICLAAVERLTDQEVLAKIVNDVTNTEVRVTVCAKLTETNLLEKLVINTAYDDVRKSTVDKLTGNSGFKYHIWSMEKGPFIREPNEQVVVVPINYVCRENPIHFGTSFGLIRDAAGQAWSDAIVLHPQENEPPVSAGKTGVMHMDFLRKYSGKGVALIFLCDKENKKISNEIMVPVELK
jgi:hypothetical protein